MASNRTHSELTVVTCHFNPAGYSSTRRNFHVFRDHMWSVCGVSVLAVEASFDGQFHCAKASQDIQIVADPDKHALWQKERLLNIAIASLPPSVTKVAWLDADILFDNTRWFADTIKALDTYPAVQPYAHCRWLQQDRWRYSRGRACVHTHRDYEMGCHPGFAWAANLDALPSGRLPEIGVCGGGDSLLTQAFTKIDFDFWRDLDGPYAEARRAYINQCPKGLGYVPGRLLHLYHGDSTKRKYMQRETDIVARGYAPEKHIKTCSETGLLAWTDEAPSNLQEYCRDYFFSREEDD